MTNFRKMTFSGSLVAFLLLAGAFPLMADTMTITFTSSGTEATITIVDPAEPKQPATVTNDSNTNSWSGTTDANGSATTRDGAVGWAFGDSISVQIDSQNWNLRAPAFTAGIHTYTLKSKEESPEPGSVVLIATGLLAVALLMRKRFAGGIRQAA